MVNPLSWARKKLMGSDSRPLSDGYLWHFIHERIGAPKADQICQELGVTPGDDQRALDNTIRKFLEAGCPEEVRGDSKAYSCWLDSFSLVGFWYLKFEYRRGRQNAGAQTEVIRDEPGQQPPAHPDLAILALVVPSPKLGGLINTAEGRARLGPADVLDLLESVSYYVCAKPETMEALEGGLTLRTTAPSTTVEEDVYLRLEVDPGADLVGRTLYGLKTALRDRPRGRSISLAKHGVLERLSGLDGFKRV
jgi:hypothetical protein